VKALGKRFIIFHSASRIVAGLASPGQGNALWALAEKWINLERFAEQFEYGRVKHAQTQNAWQAGFDGAGLSDCDAEPVQLAG